MEPKEQEMLTKKCNEKYENVSFLILNSVSVGVSVK